MSDIDQKFQTLYIDSFSLAQRIQTLLDTDSKLTIPNKTNLQENLDMISDFNENDKNFLRYKTILKARMLEWKRLSLETIKKESRLSTNDHELAKYVIETSLTQKTPEITHAIQVFKRILPSMPTGISPLLDELKIFMKL